ncbi:MAG: nucleotidyltransferase family protein [Gemmatimonadaceae bacterium]
MAAAVVLAAGASRRFGTQKLVVPIDGKPVVRWTAERVLAARVEDVVVVLGHEQEAVRSALGGLPVRTVVNDRWRDGMSTSIAAGLAALAPATRGALIVLGDQPGVSTRVLDDLIAAHEASSGSIIVPAYRGIRGNPVLFPASLFAEVMETAGDTGARDVVVRHADRVRQLDFDISMPPDIDTSADLLRYVT